MQINHSIIEMSLFASSQSIPKSFPKKAIIFPYSKLVTPIDLPITESLVNNRQQTNFIEIATQPSGIAERIKSEIEKSYMTSLTLRDLSEKLRLSLSSQTQHFKNSYHVSPSFYKKNLRIVSSMEKLLRALKNDQSINDIAFDCGYNDISRFYKQFKKLIGTTPRSIKQLQIKNNESI